MSKQSGVPHQAWCQPKLVSQVSHLVVSCHVDPTQAEKLELRFLVPSLWASNF